MKKVLTVHPKLLVLKGVAMKTLANDPDSKFTLANSDVLQDETVSSTPHCSNVLE